MKMLYGITVAMVTPFTADNQVDYAALTSLTKMLVSKGVNCLYPCGTTGEMLRLSIDERKKVSETVVKAAEGKVTVYIHCGAMNQEDTIALVRHAKAIGADGAGVVTPVFFGLNDREMERYFVEVAGSAADFPLYLYNIPQCAANDLNAEVAERIALQSPNVVGIKYSFADINRTVDYLNIRGGNFSVLHGCDRVLVGMLALGCAGTVSGCACVFPEPFVQAYELYCAGKMEQAQKAQAICVKFCDALKRGSNMAYFKAALTLRGIDAGHMRKPQLDLEQCELHALQMELEALCAQYDISLKV